MFCANSRKGFIRVPFESHLHQRSKKSWSKTEKFKKFIILSSKTNVFFQVRGQMMYAYSKTPRPLMHFSFNFCNKPKFRYPLEEVVYQELIDGFHDVPKQNLCPIQVNFQKHLKSIKAINIFSRVQLTMHYIRS